jgi:soluble lytic murein transglycosylase-like protein
VAASVRRSLGVVVALVLFVGAGQAAARKAAAAPPAPGQATYTVAAGDTLTAIAQRAGTTIAAVAQLNGIRNAHRIRIGMVLKLPTPPAPQGDPRLPDRLRHAPDRLKLMPMIEQAAARQKAPADLLKAVTWMESGWQNDKVSSTKAVGIGQLTADTVDFVNKALLRGTRLDPRKPADNVTLSARFLAYLLQQTKGDVPSAVAAYYQGLASVRAKGPIPETKAYVAAVLALRGRF